MTDCCRDDNTVSVIDGKNNTKIEDIPVGEGPSAIAVDIFRNKTYVANKDGNNISVIDAKNNTRLRDIPVAEYYDNIKGSESGA